MLLFLCFVVVCSAEAIVAPNPSGVSTACILTDPCTLRNAIDSGDASIRLLPGSYNLSTGLTINRPLSISRFDPLSTVLFDGALVTSSPLFGINCSTGSAVDVIFNGIEFQGFSAGVIRSNTNVPVIFAAGDVATAKSQIVEISDTVFDKNEMFSSNPVRLQNRIVLSIVRSLFKSNSGFSGGALLVEGEANDAVIRSSWFEGNVAGGEGGGAVCFKGSSARNGGGVTIESSVFLNNNATTNDGDGGAVFVLEADKVVVDTVLCQSNGALVGTTAGGGCMEGKNINAALLLRVCARKNVAGKGGAFVFGFDTGPHANLTVVDSFVYSNLQREDNFGGGAFFLSTFVNTTIQNTMFSLNQVAASLAPRFNDFCVDGGIFQFLGPIPNGSSATCGGCITSVTACRSSLLLQIPVETNGTLGVGPNNAIDALTVSHPPLLGPKAQLSGNVVVSGLLSVVGGLVLQANSVMSSTTAAFVIVTGSISIDPTAVLVVNSSSVSNGTFVLMQGSSLSGRFGSVRSAAPCTTATPSYSATTLSVTLSATPNCPPAPTDQSQLSTGAIVGIAVGATVGAVALVIGLVFLMKHLIKKSDEKENLELRQKDLDR